MISPQQIRAFRNRLLTWYEQNGRDLPWRRTRDPYAILVSEVMLQQTQVATVIPYYEKWLRRFPTIAALAAAAEDEVLHAWEGLGYYTRARNLRAAALSVQVHHGGQFPRDPAAIQGLPGVGRYTANAVATFAFGQSVAVVEANISRLLTRLHNIRTPIDSARAQRTLWRRAAELLPPVDSARFNSAMMDLGATVCLGRKPRCQACPVKQFCRARTPELLPIKRARPETIRRTESHLLVVRRNSVLLERCISRWRGMWMLPVLRATSPSTAVIHQSSFPFTHHRVTLKVCRGYLRGAAPVGQRWFNRQQLGAVAIPSPHRRALNSLLN